MNQKRQQSVRHNKQHKIQNNYKTILLLGRSGDGKSPLTGHLGGKYADYSQPPCSVSPATLYISERCKLNIIDAKGLDGSKTDKHNQDLMNEIYQKTISYGETALDAIIVMWSPLNQGHSLLFTTITALQGSFGKDVTKSCIFMTQGNWETLAEINQMEDSEKAVIEEKNKAVKRLFPHVPVETYDPRNSVNALKKQLEDLMKKIEPYQVKLPHKEEEVEVVQPIGQGEKRIVVESIVRPVAKFGLILTGSGAVTGMAAIAFEQSVFLAAGTIGVTAGAALLTAAAVAGTFSGLAWAVKKARSIRA